MKRMNLELPAVWQFPHTCLILPAFLPPFVFLPAAGEAFCRALTGDPVQAEAPVVLVQTEVEGLHCYTLAEGSAPFVLQAVFLAALRDEAGDHGRVQDAALADRLLRGEGAGRLLALGADRTGLESLYGGTFRPEGGLGDGYGFFRRWLAGHMPPALCDALLPLRFSALLLEDRADLRRYEAEDPRFLARPLEERLCRHLLLGTPPGRQETLYRAGWCRLTDRAAGDMGRLLAPLPLEPRPGESLWDAFLRWEDRSPMTGAEVLSALWQGSDPLSQH